MNLLVWMFFFGAALLEVGGDAVIRRGLRGHQPSLILAGCVTLAAYGVLVNAVRWDFSKILGVYVGFFALVSVLFGRIVFHERIPRATWLGLLLIIAGCLVIQFSRQQEP